ncbi:MAG: glycine C-acetyltransferase [Armatimonadetes bacterium]|nr:glycine C-acetyltransferase [Armatimonadota bacterium]MDE2207573.1 glycine C-acetyltransferase [Armatimonadota bacterium]
MDQTLQNWLGEQLDALKQQNLYKAPIVMDTPSDARITVNGRPNVINLSSNNYLGLADHPAVKRAMIEGVERWGAGAGAVRPIIGTMTVHLELEKRLAAFKHVEGSLVFQSGFTANAGTIPTVTEEGDVIITDSLNHASIIDGVRLSKAGRKIYQHCDMNSLEEALRGSRDAKKRLIITDGVFSMDGDIAPLPDIVALARQYDAAIMVDDAHGSGVLGGGRGTAFHFGVHQQIDIQLGTLSKAIGLTGGYIAGSGPLIDWLVQRGRPYLFSTAQPPAVAAAIIAAIDLMEHDTTLTDRLWENARYWKSGLQQLGFDTGISQTPITPVMIGDEAAAQQMQRDLLDRGVMALAIVFPTVALGKARLRTMPSAMHSRKDLDDALTAFEEVGKSSSGA